MGAERGSIRVKAMLIAPNDDASAHAVSLNPPTLENIFTVDGDLGHEIVFLYTGRLNPAPATAGATLTEADGTVLPVVWRPVRDEDQVLPLYPVGASSFVAAVARSPGRS